jgi:hypothetical protein
MNERIRELAKQSLPAFYLTNCPSALEKFAELIVRECAIVCETVGDVAEAVGSGDQARYSRETAHGCAGMIKDMFGVE